ncbi:MAG: PRC-barrel domain-containing protein [Deltaproteobacteria bacterium]|nr:PRC-barrel domain-containing protein [Deltaproteobacteria bacterium]
MKKFTTLPTLVTLLSCLSLPSSFTSGEGISAEAAVSVPQQQPSSCEESEPTTDLKTGVIANPEGAEIGTVKDFVLDLKAGRIAYIVGVFDQIGESSKRIFVIPWEAAKVDSEINTFTLNEGKTVLESAPSFAPDPWANLPTSQWTGAVRAYWKEKLRHNFSAVSTPDFALYKASALVGMTIKNLAGRDVGTIEQLLMEPETGSIAYAVLSFEDTEKRTHTVFYALPWDSVQVNPVQHTFVADVDRKMFTSSRGVSHERLGSNSSPRAFERRGTQTQKQ